MLNASRSRESENATRTKTRDNKTVKTKVLAVHNERQTARRAEFQVHRRKTQCTKMHGKIFAETFKFWWRQTLDWRAVTVSEMRRLSLAGNFGNRHRQHWHNVSGSRSANPLLAAHGGMCEFYHCRNENVGILHTICLLRCDRRFSNKTAKLNLVICTFFLFNFFPLFSFTELWISFSCSPFLWHSTLMWYHETRNDRKTRKKKWIRKPKNRKLLEFVLMSNCLFRSNGNFERFGIIALRTACVWSRK